MALSRQDEERKPMRSGGAAAVRVVRSMTLAAAVATGMVRPAAAITPDDPGPSDVRFTINSGSSKAISPFIYGMNFYSGSGYSNPATLDRFGGNRWTGYNWETNASNAGRDWYFQNDTHMGTVSDARRCGARLRSRARPTSSGALWSPCRWRVRGRRHGRAEYRGHRRWTTRGSRRSCRRRGRRCR